MPAVIADGLHRKNPPSRRKNWLDTTLSRGYSADMTLMAIIIERIGYKFGFSAGLLRGLNSPAEIYRPRRYSRSKQSDEAKMRSDWERIGGDFKAVIAREHGRSTSTRR